MMLRPIPVFAAGLAGAAILYAVLALDVSASNDPVGRDAAARLEQMLERAYGGDEPGAAMMVLDGDRLVLLSAAGLADVEWGVPATADTSFRIGSITKPITALAILQRAADGVLDLYRPVGSYLPGLDETLGRPTLAELMSHTSGLPDHFRLPDTPSIMRNPTTPDEIIGRMRGAEPMFEPGQAWSYSNFNYVLLGRVLEVTDPQGRTYGDIIEDDIFAPLGMTDSHYDRQPRIVPRRARGYDHDGESVLNTVTFDPSHAYAAGALTVSAADMVRLTRALMNDALLPPAWQSRAWQEVTGPDGEGFGYGLGFNVGTLMGERVIWHNGSINGFQAAWLILPDSDRAVAVLSNGYYRPNTTAMARRALAVLADNPIPELEAVAVPDADLASLQGRYVLSDGRVLQIHVEDGARYNLGGGRWSELAVTADGVLFRPDSLTHIRPRTDAPGLVFVSGTTLEAWPADPLPGSLEGARSSVSVTPDMVAAAEGRWVLESGDTVIVEADADGVLSLQLPQQPPQRLFARSARHFFCREAPIELIVGPEPGQAVLNLYGNPLPVERDGR
ncbi:serine hydrolase domain-containing protein [Maricaulis sp.]|uniref:serine hydrolase domain-containing protein n=1 Tax=Maricaulis sp. TaxID=1486257 RepID=UPI0035134111